MVCGKRVNHHPAVAALGQVALDLSAEALINLTIYVLRQGAQQFFTVTRFVHTPPAE